MTIIPTLEFAKFAQSSGVTVRPSLEHADELSLGDTAHSRFWLLPTSARRIPFFLLHILLGLDPWEQIRAWPRGGAWVETMEEPESYDTIYRTLSLGAGLPPKAVGAALFPKEDFAPLIAMAFGHAVFGWSLSDDLYILPDHCKQLVHISHHDVVDVEFLSPVAVQRFIEHMRTKNFELPTDPPDGTFKQPKWME